MMLSSEQTQMYLDLMKLQGHFRVSFVALGIDEEKALDLSCEAMHLLATSDIIDEQYRKAYSALQAEVAEKMALFDDEQPDAAEGE